MDKNKKIVVVAGPTAVGKTEYAIRIAEETGGEIVSADSMQLYKFMDIGSAKPTMEERARAVHHLVDEIDPRQPFSVAEYQKLAKKAIFDILERGKLPIISGGTGLYINSLIYDMDFSAPPAEKEYRKKLEALAEEKGNDFLHDILREKSPAMAERIHPNNLKKMIRALEVLEVSGEEIKPFENSFKKTEDYSVLLMGLTRERQELYDRIDLRVDLLVEQGLFQEVKALMDMGLTEGDISMKGIGYKEVIGALRGDYDVSAAIYLIKRNTRHYAKRQLTWLRRYDEMKWFDLSAFEGKGAAEEAIFEWLRERMS